MRVMRVGGMESPLTIRLGLPRNNLLDVLHAERWQHPLFFFQLGSLQRAPRPLQIGVDGSQVGVARRRFTAGFPHA